jgi:hypothetical protein
MRIENTKKFLRSAIEHHLSLNNKKLIGISKMNRDKLEYYIYKNKLDLQPYINVYYNFQKIVAEKKLNYISVL